MTTQYENKGEPRKRGPAIAMICGIIGCLCYGATG